MAGLRGELVGLLAMIGAAAVELSRAFAASLLGALLEMDELLLERLALAAASRRLNLGMSKGRSLKGISKW